MQVNNSVAGRILAVQREVEDGFFAWLVAGEQIAVAVQHRQPFRRQPPQRGTGGGDEEAPAVQAAGQVARPADAVTPVKQRRRQRHHLVFLLKLGHANIPCA